MKVGVALTTYGGIDPYCFHNHLSVLLHWKKTMDIEVYHVPDTQQEQAINGLCACAIRDECDFIFFMEQDNIFDKGDLAKLLAHELDVVSGYYTFRNWPFAPIPLKRDTNGLFYRLEYVPIHDRPSLIDVDVACFGCCLVKTDIIKSLFQKGLVFRREFDKKTSSTLTVDCVFFKDLKGQGVKIFVDGKVRVGHTGMRPIITPDNYRLHTEMLKIAYPELVPPNEQYSEEERLSKIKELFGGYEDV